MLSVSMVLIFTLASYLFEPFTGCSGTYFQGGVFPVWTNQWLPWYLLSPWYHASANPSTTTMGLLSRQCHAWLTTYSDLLWYLLSPVQTLQRPPWYLLSRWPYACRSLLMAVMVNTFTVVSCLFELFTGCHCSYFWDVIMPVWTYHWFCWHFLLRWHHECWFDHWLPL